MIWFAAILLLLLAIMTIGILRVGATLHRLDHLEEIKKILEERILNSEQWANILIGFDTWTTEIFRSVNQKLHIDPPLESLPDEVKARGHEPLNTRKLWLDGMSPDIAATLFSTVLITEGLERERVKNWGPDPFREIAEDHHGWHGFRLPGGCVEYSDSPLSPDTFRVSKDGNWERVFYPKSGHLGHSGPFEVKETGIGVESFGLALKRYREGIYR